MSDKLRQLSEEALQQLKEVVDDWLSRNIGENNRPNKQIDNDHQASDNYIAYTPIDGIPAMSLDLGTSSSTGSFADYGTGSLQPDTIINYADCDLYHIVKSRGGEDRSFLNQLRNKRRIYNASTIDIPGSSWVIVSKLKGGRWVVNGRDSTSDGDSTDDLSATCVDLAALRPRDCVKVTGLSQSKILSYSAGSWDSRYISDADGPTGTGTEPGYELFNYPGGSGLLSFYYADGRYRLELDGMELAYCGNGCFAGGYITGHVPENYPDTGTGTVTGTGSITGTGSSETPFVPCDGYSFLLCVSCHCCPVAGWDWPAWYCVEVEPATGTGTDATDQVCEALYVGEDDSCLDIVICSGPYDTEEEANEACGPVVQLEPVSKTCCVELMPNPLRARAVFDGACASNSKTFPIYSYDGGGFSGFEATVTLADGREWYLNLECRTGVGAGWYITFASTTPGSGACNSIGNSLISVQCSPVYYETSATIHAPCCPSDSLLTLIIDEYP